MRKAPSGWTYDVLGSYERIFFVFACLNITSVLALATVRTHGPIPIDRS